MNRRTLLSGLGVAGLTGLSGCLGLVGLAAHESAPAGVDAAVRDETGYEQTEIDEVVVEQEVGASIASEDVVVTNHATEHEKAVDMGPLGEQRGAVFTVLSTPQVEILGRQFNPVEEMSAAELVELVASNYDDIGNVSLEVEESVTILDQSTTQSRFTADASFQGTSVDVALHISEAVETDEDLLVTVGVYPAELDWREGENVISLMEGVTPDADQDASGSDGSDEPGDSNGTESDEGETDDGSDGDEDGESEDDDNGGIGIGGLSIGD